MTVAIPVSSTGPITSYSTLVAAIALYLKRDDLTDQIPMFVSFCEEEMNRRLALKPVRPMLTRTSLTVDGIYEDVPTDLMKPVAIEIEDVGQLTYVDPLNLPALKADGVMTQEEYWLGLIAQDPGTARFYTIIDDEFRFYPEPETSQSATLTYWARLPALSESAPSNWLLRDHASVYLFGSLAHAHGFVVDSEQMDRWSGYFDTLLQRVLDAYPNRSDETPLRSDTPPSNMRRTLA